MKLWFHKSPLLAAGASLLTILTLAACGISMIPTKDAWFTQHYIIMQDFERTAYRGLSEAGRQSFHDLFWKYRSAEAKATFEARLDYVMKTFWKENSKQPWNTDRGRTYLLNGSPAAIDFDQNVNFGSVALPGQAGGGTDRSSEDLQANRAEVWTYPYDKYLIKYIFVFVQPSSWKVYQTAQGNTRYLGELENNSRTVDFGVNDQAAYEKEIAALEKKR